MKSKLFIGTASVLLLAFGNFTQPKVYKSIKLSLENKIVSIEEISGEWAICFKVKELDNNRRNKTAFNVNPKMILESKGSGKVVLANNTEELFEWQLRNDTINFHYALDSKTFLNGGKFTIKINPKEKFKELELRTIKGDIYYILRRDLE